MSPAPIRLFLPRRTLADDDEVQERVALDDFQFLLSSKHSHAIFPSVSFEFFLPPLKRRHTRGFHPLECEAHSTATRNRVFSYAFRRADL